MGHWLDHTLYGRFSNDKTCYPIAWIEVLRPVLEEFIVRIHEGACETGSQIPRALARGIWRTIRTSPTCVTRTPHFPATDSHILTIGVVLKYLYCYEMPSDMIHHTVKWTIIYTCIFITYSPYYFEYRFPEYVNIISSEICTHLCSSLFLFCVHIIIPSQFMNIFYRYEKMILWHIRLIWTSQWFH